MTNHPNRAKKKAAHTPELVAAKAVAVVFSGKRAANVEAHVSRDELASIVLAAIHYDRRFTAAPQLVEALQALALIPLEDFGWGEHRTGQPIAGWNKHTLYVRDVLAARAAITAATGDAS